MIRRWITWEQNTKNQFSIFYSCRRNFTISTCTISAFGVPPLAWGVGEFRTTTNLSRGGLNASIAFDLHLYNFILFFDKNCSIAYARWKIENWTKLVKCRAGRFSCSLICCSWSLLSHWSLAWWSLSFAWWGFPWCRISSRTHTSVFPRWKLLSAAGLFYPLWRNLHMCSTSFSSLSGFAFLFLPLRW